MSHNIDRDLHSFNLKQIYRSAVECLYYNKRDGQCGHCRLWFKWTELKPCNAPSGHVTSTARCSECRVKCPETKQTFCLNHSYLVKEEEEDEEEDESSS